MAEKSTQKRRKKEKDDWGTEKKKAKKNTIKNESLQNAQTHTETL